MDTNMERREEEEMQNGIPTMILNVETGECWPEEQPSVPCDCRNKALECSIYANSSYCYTRSKGWKIPKEHSNLGSNYPAFSAVNSSLAVKRNIFLLYEKKLIDPFLTDKGTNIPSNLDL